MSFGCAWPPTLTWITLSSVGGSCCSKTLFPLKIKLLSLRFGVEWINVFVLLRPTDRCHVGEELLKDSSYTNIKAQLDESEDCDGMDSSDSDFDREDGVTYPNPSCVVVIVGWFFFWYERLQRDVPPLPKFKPPPWFKLYPILFIIQCTDHP